MLKKFDAIVCSIFIVASATIVSAAPDPLAPDDRGDYTQRARGQIHWQVVDRDPNGLNCRMGEMSIEEIWSPDGDSSLDIGSWPVLDTLSQNQYFEAERNNGGFVFTSDDNGKLWIFVKNSNCFVRANSSFVKPVKRE